MSDITSLKNAPEDSQLITITKQPRLISNKHDPVQRLPLETIANIICYLEAEDTESLRRLSKSWKSASEAFNTKEAILRHFPRSSCPPLATGPQDNLYFRRLLYHNSSLKRGRASRSHHFSDVSKWDLRSNRLVLMSQNNELSIYDLASRSGDRLEAEHCVVQSVQASRVHNFQESVVRSSVSFTVHGVIVVRFCLSLEMDPVIGWPPRTILTKISNDLSRQLSVNGQWDVVAVGTDHFYGLEFPKEFPNSPKNTTEPRLQIRRLDTEAEISDIPITRFFPYENHCVSPAEAIITSNEQFLIIKNRNRIFGLVDVSSSRVVPITGAEIPEDAWSIAIFLHPESPDFRVSVLETKVEQFSIYDYEYDAESAAYKVSLLSRVDCSKEKYDHSVVPAADFPNHLLSMRRLQNHVRSDEEKWGFVIEESSAWKERSNMTIPSHEGRVELCITRRKISRGWHNPDTTRVCPEMIDGYLVYHDIVNHTLMVADFWPSW